MGEWQYRGLTKYNYYRSKYARYGAYDVGDKLFRWRDVSHSRQRLDMGPNWLNDIVVPGGKGKFVTHQVVGRRMWRGTVLWACRAAPDSRKLKETVDLWIQGVRDAEVHQSKPGAWLQVHVAG